MFFFSELETWQYSNFFRVLVCKIYGSWKKVAIVAIRLWHLSSPCRRVCRIDGIKWCSKVLYRKSWQRYLVAKIPYMLQSVRLAPLQILWAIGGKIDLRHWGNGRIRTRIDTENFFEAEPMRQEIIKKPVMMIEWF